MQIEGKKVIDAKRPLVLSITPNDVRKGGKRDATCCAAAQACMRQLKAKRARVNLSRVYVEFPNKWVRFETPPSLRTEIVSFDRGHRFEAGDYKLNPLSPAKKASGKQQGSRTGQNNKRGKKKRRAPYHLAQGVRARASGWTHDAA